MVTTCHALGSWLSWIAVEWPWLALAGQFLTLLVQTGKKQPLFHCTRGTISGTVGRFQAVMFSPCALCVRIENGIGSIHVSCT